MARRKKNSVTLIKAERRLAGLKQIATKVDLGHGFTSATFEKEVESFHDQIEAYNALLTQADRAANALERAEKQLSVSAENVLLGVKLKYGKDSDEYEMVGGTRQSDRRRRQSKPATTAVTA